jgi:predicted phage terminase large subunit-like protein
MDIIDTCQALRDLIPMFPRIGLVLVEARANGDAVIQTLRREGHGKVVGYDPKASKPARAAVAAVSFESAEVWLPQAEHAPWISDWIEEVVAFPAGANDDRVDGMSQLFVRWDGERGEVGGINADYGFLNLY